MDTTTDSTETILRSVLDQWKAAVDAHDPKRVAVALHRRRDLPGPAPLQRRTDRASPTTTTPSRSA